MTLRLLIFSCIVRLSFKDTEAQCKKLSNGTYHVIFDKKFKAYHNYDLTIKDSKYFKILKLPDIDSGSVVWVRECCFKLMSFSKPKEESDTSYSHIMKRAFGDEYMELMEIKGNTINFKTAYEANPSIIMSEGKLIKVN